MYLHQHFVLWKYISSSFCTFLAEFAVAENCLPLVYNKVSISSPWISGPQILHNSLQYAGNSGIFLMLAILDVLTMFLP